MKIFNKVSDMFSRDTANSPASSDISLKNVDVISPQIIDGSKRNGYLAGQLLVATPLINSGCFQKSVIYVFAHNEEGAMGLIINQPIELINYAALLEGLDMPHDLAEQELPVYFGGPCERARGFVVHSTDYYRDFSLTRTGDIAVTASTAILNDIMGGRGPRDAVLAVGYAGWTAGQLEAEIEANSWITVPATPQLVFGTENELKWSTASQSLGVDMAFFSTTVGHA